MINITNETGYILIDFGNGSTKTISHGTITSIDQKTENFGTNPSLPDYTRTDITLNMNDGSSLNLVYDKIQTPVTTSPADLIALLNTYNNS
jgi:hypothetical protein